MTPKCHWVNSMKMRGECRFCQPPLPQVFSVAGLFLFFPVRPNSLHALSLVSRRMMGRGQTNIRDLGMGKVAWIDYVFWRRQVQRFRQPVVGAVWIKIAGIGSPGKGTARNARETRPGGKAIPLL